MIPFQLTILGTNSATPGYGRFTSHQILNVNHKLYLIDCGEGTQIRFNQYKIKKNKIEAIFISHHHGDHIYGLPGLLTSFTLIDRKKKLILYGPIGTQKFINTILNLTNAKLSYELDIQEITHNEGSMEVYSNNDVRVYAFPMQHRIPTYGFLFVEQQGEINIDKNAIKKFNLTVPEILELKKGKNVIRRDGFTIQNQEATLNLARPRSYAYCSDTIYDPHLVRHVKGANVLYHETTYLEEFAHLAEERMHATAKQAANIAKMAQVGQLITGHYSNRYKNVDAFKTEAETIFPNVLLGYDGSIINIE